MSFLIKSKEVKPASLSQIKKELQLIPADRLTGLILRLCKYKTENKELLSYLLFDSDELANYISDLKVDIDVMLEETLQKPLYQIKKGIRKIQRMIARFSRYTGFKETEVELLMYFSRKLKDSGILERNSRQIMVIYEKQLDKITGMLLTVHEDLRTDYAKDLLSLSAKKPFQR
jgi:hypothetical protein